MEKAHKMWVEKYRPLRLKDYIFYDDSLKEPISKMVDEKSIPHLLFSSTASGTGKTTVALILINEMELDPNDVMSINASDENSVDIMRDKIKSFVSTVAFSKFKVVHLEEADRFSPAALDALRRIMEEYSDTARFILTCNNENRISSAIKSRCQHFRFKSADKNDIAEMMAKMLIAENVKFDLAVLDKYIAVGYPDIRKIINLIQPNAIDGKLLDFSVVKETGDYKIEILNLLETNNWKEMRNLICANASAEEWESIYRFLYENLHRSPKFKTDEKWEDGIVLISKFLSKHTFAADPEINAASMFILLSRI